MAGIDLVTLAAMLGHSRIQMVLRYAHPTEEHQFAAMKSWKPSGWRDSDWFELRLKPFPCGQNSVGRLSELLDSTLAHPLSLNKL